MFSLRTDLLAWTTSQPSTQNKACTPTHNEQFLGVNSPVENVHGLESMKRLILCFFIFINNIVASFSYYSVVYGQFSSLVCNGIML